MRLSALAAAVAAVCLFSHAALAQIIRVPQDQPTIQAAINAAPNGAQIVVAPGVYLQNLAISAKVLTIRSEAGAGATSLSIPTGRVLTINSNAVVTLEGFTITPSSPTGQCGLISTASTLAVRDCLFRDCHAPTGGGGAAQIIGGTASFANCRFIGNSATNFGGAISVNSSGVLTAHNCLFQQNASGIAGGAIDLQPATASLVGCLFVGNTTANGGGLATVTPGSLITGCTFAGNTITTGVGQAVAFGGAGGVDVVTIGNSIFWGNQGGGGASPAPIAATSGPSTTFAVTYSNVQGGHAGAGNIDADPMFVAVGAPGDYRLQPGSPCIDAGNNAAIPADVLDADGDGDISEPLPLDLAGSPRRADDPATPDTGAGPAPIVDIGAHEFAGAEPCRADFDGDGQVNSNDISSFLTEWLQAVTNGCP